jgi:hypothetical protein
VRDAAPERAGLHRRAQPWEQWTPELDAALTLLLPLLEARKIFAIQGGEPVLWTDPNLIKIRLRAGNWFEWLAVILTMDPPVLLDVADLVEALPQLEQPPIASPVEHPGAAPSHTEPEGRDGSTEPSAPPPGPVEQAKLPLTPSQKEMLVDYAKAKWGHLAAVPGREVTQPALETELGRRMRRVDYRAVMSKGFPSEERKGGRPKRQKPD